MRTAIFLILIGASIPASGQGSLVYDQQSATGGTASHGNQIQALQPIGQSFIPTLSSVGFVELQFADGTSGDGAGAVIYVNLLANSITGGVVATTSPVFLRDSFFGSSSLFFTLNVPVIPGTTYYFQPILQSGDQTFLMLSDHFNYPDGSALFFGQPDPSGKDFWFREGIVVPEPSSFFLILLGVGLWVVRRRRPVLIFRTAQPCSLSQGIPPTTRSTRAESACLIPFPAQWSTSPSHHSICR